VWTGTGAGTRQRGKCDFGAMVYNALLLRLYLPLMMR
jgi:hypothetical protein